MTLNRATALTLRLGIVAGLVLIVIGLVLEAGGSGDGLLRIGILVLIASPFLGVVVTFLSLLKERDWTWALVAAVLLAVTVSGVLLSL